VNNNSIWGYNSSWWEDTNLKEKKEKKERHNEVGQIPSTTDRMRDGGVFKGGEGDHDPPL